ncbi:alpha/beta hydrolase [Bacillus sp. JJ1533]|uniref:alpha/beta fold hydrolase n=1 Tax=Bacillus sp. JJ1533 TaxID=3122959 RepID=UPI002FFDFA1C
MYFKVKDETEIYYEYDGKGEPLVFIHGLGASSEMYNPQVEYFKKFFKVILIDLRGNGKSGKLDCSVDKVLDKQMEDIKELLQTLEIEQAIFVGVSYGGVLIQKLAITYPDIVKAIVISDSFCDTTIDSLQKRIAMFGANQTWVLQMPKKWLAKLTKASYKNWILASQEMEKVMLNLRKEETILQRRAINNIKFNKALETLNKPILCIVGNHTKLGIQMMKQISDITNTELRIIEDSFDPSNLCQPKVFNGIVHNFLLKL